MCSVVLPLSYALGGHHTGLKILDNRGDRLGACFIDPVPDGCFSSSAPLAGIDRDHGVDLVSPELDDLAADEAVADHAVVDGYLNELRQAKQDADAAIEALSAYREDVDQA